jgi:GcrA cell cycle regulator
MSLNENTCKWPNGDPSDKENFAFCGQRSKSLTPYCEYHSRIAYQPVERRPAKKRAVHSSQLLTHYS